MPPRTSTARESPSSTRIRAARSLAVWLESPLVNRDQIAADRTFAVDLALRQGRRSDPKPTELVARERLMPEDGQTRVASLA